LEHYAFSLYFFFKIDRNHGSDYGRVLIGLQLLSSSNETKEQVIKKLKLAGNKYVFDETENPVYKHFIQ
jgi:threonine dehydratase